MNMKQWFSQLNGATAKKALPILSFPSTSILGISVRELISDSHLQAQGMKLIADRCDTLASVSLMDLSLEAEAFGSTIKVDDNEVPTVTGHILHSEEDTKRLAVPAIGAGRTGIYIEAAKKASQLITDRPVFAGVIGPFSLSARLIDMTEIMINCYADPDMVHTCMEKTTEFLIAYTEAYKKTGVNGIVMAEPAAGLLSPQLIEEFSTPYVKRIVDRIQSDDFAFIYHNCGNTIPLVDSITQIGAYAYHFGNAINISEMLPLMPSDVIVMGNIDPVSQFINGTPASVYAKATELLTQCAGYPNFVISSGCDIPPIAPWENIDSFFKAVSDFYQKG